MEEKRVNKRSNGHGEHETTKQTWRKKSKLSKHGRGTHEQKVKTDVANMKRQSKHGKA